MKTNIERYKLSFINNLGNIFYILPFEYYRNKEDLIK